MEHPCTKSHTPPVSHSEKTVLCRLLNQTTNDSTPSTCSVLPHNAYYPPPPPTDTHTQSHTHIVKPTHAVPYLYILKSHMHLSLYTSPPPHTHTPTPTLLYPHTPCRTHKHTHSVNYGLWLLHSGLCKQFVKKKAIINIIVVEWSGRSGVAGTQHHTQAKERPQQAAYSSNKNFILQTKPAQNQHECNRHTQPNIHCERRPQRKQANSAIESCL